MKFLATLLFTFIALANFAQNTILDVKIGMTYSEVNALAQKNGVTLDDEPVPGYLNEDDYNRVKAIVQLEGIEMQQHLNFFDGKLETIGITARRNNDDKASIAYMKRAAKALKSYYEEKHGKLTKQKMDYFHACRWEVDLQPYLLLYDKRYTAVMVAGGKNILNDDALEVFDRMEAKNLGKKVPSSNSEPKKSKIRKIEEGMSEQQVIDILGQPSMSMTIIDETVMTYGSYMITLKDDAVTSVERADIEDNTSAKRRPNKFKRSKVKEGMTEKQVRKACGEPDLAMTIMDETVWTYGEYMLTCKDGVVTMIEKATEVEEDY